MRISALAVASGVSVSVVPEIVPGSKSSSYLILGVDVSPISTAVTSPALNALSKVKTSDVKEQVTDDKVAACALKVGATMSKEMAVIVDLIFIGFSYWHNTDEVTPDAVALTAKGHMSHVLTSR